MEIPLTILTLVESSFIGVLLGTSTMAVISYALSLRHGYPKDGFGNILIQAIYKVLRVFHILMAILVVIYIVIFGIFDGIVEARVEYGIKAFILIANGVVAYLMSKRFFPVMYTAPIIAAGWYFLASYHSYTVLVVSKSILIPLVWYILFISLFQMVFYCFERFIKKI